MSVKNFLFKLNIAVCITTTFASGEIALSSKTTLPIIDIEKSIEREIDKKVISDKTILDEIKQNKNGEGSAIGESETLPSGYCLRDDYAIFAQDQSVQGLCWNFGALMSISTAIMRETGEYLEFSDSWVSLARTVNENSYSPGAGGWDSSTETVAKKNGLVLEQDFPYEESFFLTRQNKDAYHEMYSQYASKEYYNNIKKTSFNVSNMKSSDEAKSQAEINKIKSHIYNYSSVTAALTWSGYFQKEINGVQCTFKTPGDTSGGHLVALIGWDDNISAEYNGTTYTGAFIALNSFSNENKPNGIHGIVYLFYKDKSFYGSMSGYMYEENYGNSEFYLASKIDSSNAVFESDFKGFTYGDHTYNHTITKQKNIFKNQKDVNIKYTFSCTDGIAITNVRVYKNGVDVSRYFDIDFSNENKYYTVKGKNLKIGSYKVVVTYSNGESVAEHYNAFYMLNGTEINLLDLEESPEEFGTVDNNGFYLHFNNFNYIDEVFTYGTSKLTGSLKIRIVFATYHDVSKIVVDGVETAYDFQTQNNYLDGVINYNLEQTTKYYVDIYSKSGVHKVLTVNILHKPDVNTKMAYMLYQLNGGINNPENTKREYVSLTNAYNTEIYTPTREGYEFLGWYTSNTFDESTKLTCIDGKYYINYSNALDYETDTLYWSWRYKLSYKDSVIVPLYAKWGEKQNATSLCIQANSETFYTDSAYNFDIETNVDNPYIYSIKWYLNDEYYDVEKSNTINISNLEKGKYTLKCIVNDSLESEIIFEVKRAFKWWYTLFFSPVVIGAGVWTFIKLKKKPSVV